MGMTKAITNKKGNANPNNHLKWLFVSYLYVIFPYIQYSPDMYLYEIKDMRLPMKLGDKYKYIYIKQVVMTVIV